MTQFPETRESLIVQVKDPENRVAWEQFVSIYRPVIFRTAVARGMQQADAQDLSQQVLLAVVSAIGRWEKQDEPTRFRHWLRRVTRQLNLLVTDVQKTRSDGPLFASDQSGKIHVHLSSKLVEFEKSAIEWERWSPVSWMAAGLLHTFGAGDIRDLLAFLESDG